MKVICKQPVTIYLTWNEFISLRGWSVNEALSSVSWDCQWLNVISYLGNFLQVCVAGTADSIYQPPQNKKLTSQSLRCICHKRDSIKLLLVSKQEKK